MWTVESTYFYHILRYSREGKITIRSKMNDQLLMGMVPNSIVIVIIILILH